MSSKSAVSLTMYQADYREALMKFHLPWEQAEFTGLPAETLDDALREEGKYPVVIIVEDEAAGFFILHSGPAIASFYTPWRDAVLLRAFLVNYSFQGQGIAKAALALLPGFVCMHIPAAREIVLAVNERNIPAARLYTKAGFKDNGLRRTGGKGLQQILQYGLGNIQQAAVDSGKEAIYREHRTVPRSVISEEIYRTKIEKWQNKWPELQVIPWTE